MGRIGAVGTFSAKLTVIKPNRDKKQKKERKDKENGNTR